MQPDGTTIVRLERVGLRYDPNAEVLRDIDLTLAAGTFHFLVGPVGAGKTSLIRLLNLTQVPSRGRMVLFGRDVAQLDQGELIALRRRIGVVDQDFRLLDEMSAFDNLALPLRLADGDAPLPVGQVADLLDWLGLGDVLERRPGALSTGQRRLLAAGRATIGRPQLLLADCPTCDLDGDSCRRLMRLLLALHERGTTVVLATHDERLVRRHGFRTLELAAGGLRRPPALAASRLSA